MAEIVSAWRAAVGEAIARNAWPARLTRDRVLHVNTSSSSWAFELVHLAPHLLVRLREEVGESAPKSFRFAPGPLPETGAEVAVLDNTAPPAEPTPEDRELAAALASGIADEELRKLVARAAAASLSRRPDDR